MHSMRTAWPLRAAAGLVFLVVIVAWRTTTRADNGNAPATLSFFSGGIGAHADWFATSDQPPGDTDNQAIRLITADGAPTFEKGYAGILFHHVTGIPAGSFPDSAFWNKVPCSSSDNPATLGSPRLVVEFQNALGQFDGYADLRENTRGCDDWEMVADSEFPVSNPTFGMYPNSGWDVMNTPPTNPCYPFKYNLEWSAVQACFAGDRTLSVFLVADAYGIYHLIDDITVNGKRFSSASDNGGGNNDPAGPDATTDPTLLPPILILTPPQ